MPAGAISQDLVWRDTTVLVTLKHLADPGSTLVRFRFIQELEYTLSFSNLRMLNRQQEPNVNQVSLLQHIRYQSRLTNDGNLKIVNTFVHDLGIQCIFDSLSRFQPDENTLDTRFEISMKGKFTLSVFSKLTTRIFNSYNYTAGQGGNQANHRSPANLVA